MTEARAITLARRRARETASARVVVFDPTHADRPADCYAVSDVYDACTFYDGCDVVWSSEDDE
jgi:hypothetical protein